MDRLQARRERLELNRKRLWHVALWLALAGAVALFLASPSVAADSLSDTSPLPGTMDLRPLSGTYWRLLELGGSPSIKLDRLQEPHLTFSAKDARLTGSSGCNRLVGRFENQGSALRLGPVASTRMACVDPAMAQQEQQVLTRLQQVRGYQIQGEELTLLDDVGQTLMKLQSVMLR